MSTEHQKEFVGNGIKNIDYTKGCTPLPFLSLKGSKIRVVCTPRLTINWLQKTITLGLELPYFATFPTVSGKPQIVEKSEKVRKIGQNEAFQEEKYND